ESFSGSAQAASCTNRSYLYAKGLSIGSSTLSAISTHKLFNFSAFAHPPDTPLEGVIEDIPVSYCTLVCWALKNPESNPDTTKPTSISLWHSDRNILLAFSYKQFIIRQI